MNNIYAVLGYEFANNTPLKPLCEQVHGDSGDDRGDPLGESLSKSPQRAMNNGVGDIKYSILIARINGVIQLGPRPCVHNKPSLHPSLPEKTKVMQRENCLSTKPG